MKHKLRHLVIVASLTLVMDSPAAPADPSASQAVRDWQALRYGMFIHFGMSTFTGREIDPGDKPSTTYAPTDLDALKAEYGCQIVYARERSAYAGCRASTALTEAWQGSFCSRASSNGRAPW